MTQIVHLLRLPGRRIVLASCRAEKGALVGAGELRVKTWGKGETGGPADRVGSPVVGALRE